MKIERLPLLQALETIKPALASKDLVEELSHFWFDGKHVMAYNDAELGIQVPLETPFVGGIRGALLLGLLHNSRAKEISLEDVGEGLMLLKAARTKATLTVLDLERSPWKFPAPSNKTFPIEESLVEALQSTMIATGKDSSIPETMGVTFIEDGMLHLYATDSSNIIARSNLKTPKGLKAVREIVPKGFCEQLLRVCADGGTMEFRKDCVLARNEESGVELYGRLIQTTRPLDFEDMIAKHSTFKKNTKFDVPERLSLALDRMSVLFDGMVGEAMTVKLGGGHMILSASVEGRGELKDSMDIPATVPELTFKTEPGLIRRALELVKYMVCSEDSVLMGSDHSFLYLVSNAVS